MISPFLVGVVAFGFVLVFVFWGKLVEAVHFLSRTPNPVLQFVYLTLVFGIFHVFRNHGFHLVSGVHHVGTWVMVLLASFLFVALCFSNPVVITRSNEKQLASAAKPDGLLFPLEEKDCASCKVKRLARGKHCAVCNRCVHLFDHHCYWANTCIARNNKALFLSFLLATALLCFYCVYLCSSIVLKLSRQLNVPVNGVGDFLTVFLLRGGVFRNMAIITLVAGVAVALFFGFHFWLACKNMTTNELSFEWSCLVFY